MPICGTRGSVYPWVRPQSNNFGNKPYVCLSETERVRKQGGVLQLIGTQEGIDPGLWAGCQGSMAAIMHSGSTVDLSSGGCRVTSVQPPTDFPQIDQPLPCMCWLGLISALTDMWD